MNIQTLNNLREAESESTNSEDTKFIDDNDSVVSSGIESVENVDELTNREKEAMRQVFQIPSMVEQIIQEVEHLCDLKNCRLVNSMWKETVTKLMLKTNSIHVSVNLDSESSTRTHSYTELTLFNLNFRHDSYIPSYYVQDANDLTTLKEIVNTSTKFPCSTFFMYEGEFRNQTVENFFKVVGKSIKNLKLVRVNGMLVSNFADIIRINCPNLETIYFEGYDISWSHDDISFELPKLTMLDMNYTYVTLEGFGGSPFKVLATLIAPNLQVIRGFNLLRDWEEVYNARKLLLVRDLTCTGVGESGSLTKLETFVDVGLQLELLDVRIWSAFDKFNFDEKRKWMMLMRKLLNSNRTTLTSLRFDGIEKMFNNLCFPQLSQLKEIKIDSLSATEGGVTYPYEILSNNICPNLQVIKGFHLIRDTTEVVRVGKIHCVKELYFHCKNSQVRPLRDCLDAGAQLESLGLFGLEIADTCEVEMIFLLEDLLQDLLALNKDSLKNLKFGGVGTGFENMKFPKFSKLRHLKVGADDPVRIFPRGINLAETFPVLEILNVYELTSLNRNMNWNTYFPDANAFTGSLPCVKTLIVPDGITEDSKTKLRLICPNAQVARIS